MCWHELAYIPCLFLLDLLLSELFELCKLYPTILLRNTSRGCQGQDQGKETRENALLPLPASQTPTKQGQGQGPAWDDFMNLAVRHPRNSALKRPRVSKLYQH